MGVVLVLPNGETVVLVRLATDGRTRMDSSFPCILS